MFLLVQYDSRLCHFPTIITTPSQYRPERLEAHSPTRFPYFNPTSPLPSSQSGMNPSPHETIQHIILLYNPSTHPPSLSPFSSRPFPPSLTTLTTPTSPRFTYNNPALSPHLSLCPSIRFLPLHPPPPPPSFLEPALPSQNHEHTINIEQIPISLYATRSSKASCPTR